MINCLNYIDRVDLPLARPKLQIYSVISANLLFHAGDITKEGMKKVSEVIDNIKKDIEAHKNETSFDPPVSGRKRFVSFPTITKWDPVSNAVNVPANKIIKITFSKPIIAGDNFWVELINSRGTQIEINKSLSDNTLTIKPVSPLTEGKYNLVLHTGCVTDKYGNPLKVSNIYFSVSTSLTSKL